MRLLSYFSVFLICFLSYSQERTDFNFSRKLSVPSLSYIAKQKVTTTKYTLMEVNLAVDLRKQALQKNVSPLTLPQDQSITSSYKVIFPENNLKVYGTGYNGIGTINGGIKNNAYQDASLYSGAFCPMTGVFY